MRLKQFIFALVAMLLSFASPSFAQSNVAKVATKAELNAALAAAKDGDVITLTADIDYGTDQLAIAKAITLDLGGKTLTTRNAWGGMSIKNNPTVKNGNIVHASNTAAIKVWNATAFEDLVIDVQGKGDANKTIGGIVLQSGSTTRVGSIKNVTIKGAALTNGIETYNCGDATENVIGSMENVTINALGTGLLISAPCGTATNCDITGGVNGVEIFIKGNYSASLDLVNSKVDGGVYAHDEFSSNPSIVNNGTLNFTADAATTGASAEDVTLEIARAEAGNVNGVLNDVMKNAQAKLNNVYYATLDEAFKAAAEGATITLLADATPALTSQRAITKAAVIDLGGKTLTLTEDDLYFGTTTFKNGTIVVDPSVHPSTAVFWMFANQTLTFDAVKVIATGVTGTYLIGLDGNNSDLNLLNGSEILIENTTALDLDVICVNASTGNDIVVENSKVKVTNLDGRVFFRGNYTVKDSEVSLAGITKAGFRIEADQTLSIKGTSTVTIEGEPRDGGIHITDATATYTKAETATVNATVYAPAKGSNSFAYTKEENGYVRVWGEGGGNAKKSYELKLYSGETLIATTKLNNEDNVIDGDVYVTWNFYYPESTDKYWTTTWEEGHPNSAAQPTEVELYIDGTLVATTAAKMSGADDVNPVVWRNLGGVAIANLLGEGTAENPYLIETLKDLKFFRDDVNTYTQDGSNQYKGKYVKLTADIDLAGENWEPIGKNSNGDHQNFLGTFYGEKADGTKPTISNLYINADGDHLGFFARVGSYDEGLTPTVKNIKFNNVYVSSKTNGSYVAGVIANAGGNSVVSGIEVTGNVYVEGYGYIGGIVGHGYPDIDNCHVAANDGSYINSHYWCVGGIIGYAGEGGTPITNSSVSGVDIWSAYGGAAAIAGLLNEGNKLENVSASNVDITSNSDYYMGYIAGNGNASTMTGISIENVTATAKGNPITPTDAVAKVNDAIYFSLQEALNAAQAGETVTLIADVALTETLTVAAGKNVVLDLNGKKVESADITVTVFGELAVVDNTENKDGKIISTHATGNEAVAVKDGGKFTLNSGNIEGASYGIYLYTSGGTAIINGGTITLGGEFKDGMTVAVASDKCSLTVTGGTFAANGVNWPIYTWGENTIELKGGMFDFKPNSLYIAERYAAEAVADKDGWFKVVYVEPMITIEGGDSFYTLSDAFAAAKENDVIVIKRAGEYVWPGTAIPAGVTVKATVEGVVAVSTGDENAINATTLNVENVDFKASFKAAFVGNGKAKNLTFTDCSFTGVYAFHVDYAAAGAELNFNNCVFNGFTTFATTVEKINIEGGNVNGALIVRQDAAIENVVFSEDAVIQLGTSDAVTDKDIAIVDCTVADTNGDGTVPEVLDIFNGADSVDDSNFVVVNGAIISGAVAQVGETKYATLAEAVAAADDDDTVTLLKDITYTKETGSINGGYVDGLVYTGDKNFTVDFAGHIVTENGDINDYLVYLKNTGEKDNEITFKNGTIAINSQSTATAWAAITVGSGSSTHATTLNLEGMKVINGNPNAAANQVIRSRNGATVNLNEGTLVTSNGTSYGVVAETTATVNINDGAKVVHTNSKTTGGNQVYTAVSGNGVINIHDGAVIESDNYGIHNMTTGNAVINIEGGTITAPVIVHAATNGGSGESADVYISGGTFHGAMEEYTNTANIHVSGGVFDRPVAEEFCAEDYAPCDNADGTYGVYYAVLDNFEIIDGDYTEFENPMNMTVGTLTYKRTLNANNIWLPLFVPFEIPVSYLNERGYEVATFYDVHFSILEGGVVDLESVPDIHLIKINGGTLKANYPYVIRAKSDASLDLVITLEGVTLYSTAKSKLNVVESSTTTTRFEFAGTYVRATGEQLTGDANVPFYVITKKGEMAQFADPASRLSPFRVYMTIWNKDGSHVILNGNPAASIAMRVIGEENEDGTTSIYDVYENVDSNGMIFDLQGRRVLEPQKGGMYIIDGKKVIY